MEEANDVVDAEAVDAVEEAVVGAIERGAGAGAGLMPKSEEDDGDAPSVSSSASRNSLSLAAVASRSFFKSSLVTE